MPSKAAHAQQQRRARELGIPIVVYLDHRDQGDVYCHGCGVWKPRHDFNSLHSYAYQGKCKPCKGANGEDREALEIPQKFWGPYNRAAKLLGITIQSYVLHRRNGEAFCMRCRVWYVEAESRKLRPNHKRVMHCPGCLATMYQNRGRPKRIK